MSEITKDRVIHAARNYDFGTMEKYLEQEKLQAQRALESYHSKLLAFRGLFAQCHQADQADRAGAEAEKVSEIIKKFGQ